MAGGQGGDVASLITPPTNGAAGEIGDVLGQINDFASEATGIEDPISMLVGTGVDFVISYVPPVEQAIQLVTGDGDALRQSADAFTELQQKTEKLAEELANTFDDQLSGWQGEAADAARKKLASFTEGVQNTGMQSHNISELLKMSAVMMDAAEDILKGILADFLTWAITTWIAALAAEVPSCGSSTAVAAGATAAEATVTCSRASTQVQRVLKIIDTISTLIENIQTMLDAVRVVDSVQTITSGSGDENSGDDLVAAQENAGAAGDQVENVGDQVKEHAENQGIDTEGNGSGSGGQSTSSGNDSSSDSDSESGADGERQTAGSVVGNSAAEHGKESLGNAADDLQEQAKEGGFSKVPSDQTMSGQLDV